MAIRRPSRPRLFLSRVEPGGLRDRDRAERAPRVGAFDVRALRLGAAIVVLWASLGLTGGLGTTAAADAPFVARGSVNQVYTYGHPAGSTVELVDDAGSVVATGVADAQGAFLFKSVAKATGYRVREGDRTVDGISVTGPADHPSQSFYTDPAKQIPLPAPGEHNRYTYIETRDGTLLSANVVFPDDGTKGPWPVVVNYSGYDPSQGPGAPPESSLFPFAGYVTVGINLRGTTCSGGAFDIFETLQTLDGYDAIETLAAQSWSTGHVGMVGISFPGITQLFVAQTQPPHLDAITPLSTYADFYRGIGYPGGIINDGFFLTWLAGRDADSQPAAHGWVQERIAHGDTTCAQNQVMRLQSHKLVPEARPGRLYESQGDSLSPQNFVSKIKAPTFLAGQFQDEQTGGHWSTMVPLFDPATKLKVSLTNGTHVDPLGPEHIARVLEFLDFYVAKKIPVVPPILRLGIPPVLKDTFGGSPTTPPWTLQPAADRFTQYGNDYAAALAAYEHEPKVRVYWENGYPQEPGRQPGEPYSSFAGDYASWPLPGVVPQPYYFQADGRLGPSAPAVADDEARGFSSYAYDPSSKDPKRTFAGNTSGMWAPLPDVTWKPLAEGSSLSFVTKPFTTKTAFAGWGSADLWVRSTEADTDVEVTLTEVRPDGKETYIQSGWLRASHRKLAAGSDELMPRHTHIAADFATLPSGQFDLMRVEIYPFTHVIRPGSRLRVNVEAPGGNQPFWQVDPMTFDHAVTNDVAHSIGRPSRIVLPIVPDNLMPAVPDAPPACPGLRGQACRDYRPARIPSDVLAQVHGPDVDVSWTVPPGPAPDQYHVTVSPTGETVTVPGTMTGWRAVGLPAGAPLTFRVAAIFGAQMAPASSASLAVTIDSSSTATTTTSIAPPTTSEPTAAASGSAVSPAGQRATTSTGDERTSLPRTGLDVTAWLLVAAVLVLAGAALITVTRRRRSPV